MGFLFAAALALLVAAVVLRSAHPRRALAVAAIGVVGGLVALGLLVFDTTPSAPADIAVENLTLSSVVITRDRYGDQLSGQVRNVSARRLGQLTLKVTYRACNPDGACTDVGEESPRVFLALPSGQTGGFSILLTKADLAGPPAREPGQNWTIAIASAQSDF